MTKNILLAATALSALAFAGSASAIDITAATVSGVANAAPATSSNAYRLATQSVIGTGLSTTTSASGTTNVTSALSTTSGLAVGTYVLRFDYTGIAGFTDTPVLTVAGAAGCTTASTLSTGGGTTQNFVEYAVTISGATCTTNPTFQLAAGFKETTLGGVTVKSGLTLNGVSIDNSAAAVARSIVQLVSGYDFSISGVVDNKNSASNPADSPTIDNADFPTRLALGTGTTPYTGFTTGAQAFDNIIGALGYAPTAATTYLTLLGAGGATTATTTPLMDVTVNGAFQGLNVRLTTADDNTTGILSPTSSNTTTAQFTGIAGTRYNVVLLASGTTTQLGGGNYNAAFATQANASLNAPIAVAQTGLETVNLEGTNFIAPWLQMQSSYTAVVRISNIGGTATGPITLTLRSNNGGTVNQTCQLTQAMLQSGTLVGGGIDQNRAIEFTGKSLADNCFGTTSTNADLQVTIQGTSTNLTAKVRVINPGGTVVETSLGRLGETHVAF